MYFCAGIYTLIKVFAVYKLIGVEGGRPQESAQSERKPIPRYADERREIRYSSCGDL